MGESGGKRRVTAADVARSLGISRATVGYVLNNTPGQTISAATRERVLSEAARRGYRPRLAAQALASGRSRIILLVMPDWPLEFSLQLALDETAAALDQAGYSLVTYTRHSGGRSRPLWELLDPDVVIGFGMADGVDEFSPEEVASMQATGVTKIVPDPRLPDAASPYASAEPVVAGSRLQVEHLHGLGHQRLAIAESPDPRHALLAVSRSQAARQAAEHLGLQVVDACPVDHRDGSADRAVRAWRESGVTGVVAFNDSVAASALGAAVRAGISVPDDLAVIGHDDTPWAAVFVPSISSIGFDAAGLGRHLAAVALHEADGRPITEQLSDFEVTVVARESTGR
ncbi:LacI family DNA-binding transcriptional regulator [Streptomyces reticuliscabiei]|uniref:LacI family DNA-binding transcriptional regulator n=1 Tax=Streptomyces reticuliscabiei TaxID=146821 RepID=UPI000A3C734C|nr:LacI family DNA-binding transcriptional regulator [Streptomyces reticuliscabiei]